MTDRRDEERERPSREEDKRQQEEKEKRSDELKESWRRNHPSKQDSEAGGKGR